MKLLDLYCGAGGCAEGYRRAGFDEIVGIDLKPQRRYPFDFIQADGLNPPVDLRQFDLIHASPPCQGYSKATFHLSSTAERGGDIDAVRDMLMASGVPWVIENVEGAKAHMQTGLFTGSHTITLCGEMFGLRVIRHRLFECSWPIRALPHLPHNPLGATSCNTKESRRKRRMGDFHYYTVVGKGAGCTADEGREAMGIPWMSRDELSQAIPPAYTEYVGKSALEHIKSLC